MRRLIAIVNIFFVLSIILAGCGGSDDDNQAASPTERADFVDVAASWNEDRSAAVMVDSDGNIMTARSGSIVWRVPDDKNFVVFYDGSGLPTRVVGEGYVILYGNWTATTVDIAVMSSDGTYTVNKNVAADSSSMTSVSGDTLAENIKASGTIASGAVCAAGVAAAQSSAGTLSALTALACASTAMNVGTLLIPEDNEDLSGTAEKIPTFVSATSSALECVPDEVLACVDGVVVSSTPAKSAAENYMADKSVAITIAESDLLGHSKIPDTGQTSCYNVAGSIITTCPAPEDPMAQDGSYTANAPSYTVNSDETVTDNETYLLWQKDGSTNLTWDGAVSYCSSLPLGGYSDWRLPNSKELQSIVDYKRFGPAVDVGVFAGVSTGTEFYWSSTTHANLAGNSWYVKFGSGRVYYGAQGTSYNVRCVRGGSESVWSFDFSDGGDVTGHGRTGLMWQKEDDDATKTWDSALTYCEDLDLGGYDDWRLPNAKELQTIVDFRSYLPAIDEAYFPNTNDIQYWTSTTDANSPDLAWYVKFNDGNVGTYGKGNVYYARCVRGGR